MPMTLAVLSLTTDDPNVATSSLASGPASSLSVPRRPNKHSAATPSNATANIGLWSPQNLGNTTVRAQVNVQGGLSVVNPDDDVQVV
jgi:hypothetical protein